MGIYIFEHELQNECGSSRFIPSAAHIQAPLLRFLKNSRKRDTRPIDWDSDTEAAFNTCKRAIAETTQLAHPEKNPNLELSVDASDVAIGAALHQLTAQGRQPLVFLSRRLSDTERRYSAYDRELLAAYAAVRQFRHWLEGRQFVIRTDHKPLTYAFRQTPDKASPRIDEVSAFEGLNYTQVAQEQAADSQLQSYLQDTPDTPHSTAMHLSSIPIGNTGQTLVCDTSTGAPIYHSNLESPLAVSRGYPYCLTCVDRFSRWPEAIPLGSVTAAEVAAAFYQHWIARFGCPATITTDQGTQFTSRLYQELAALTGAQIKHTSAYHPQANGIIERWHRLRAAVREDTGLSPAEYTYGTTLRLPGDFFADQPTIMSQTEFVAQLKQTI
ncbi:uncharacterized protein, partial [Rhodnius prolixus]|uniref:uncharacterized protein n=1 Tax=Rhodnius prolixus TaxID=13249 RepID=UPI003D1880DA